MNSDDVVHNIFGNKNSGIEVSESTKNNSFSSVAKLSTSAFSAELENNKAHNEVGQNIKPQETNALFLETRI
jgi:hypothetical protein